MVTASAPSPPSRRSQPPPSASPRWQVPLSAVVVLVAGVLAYHDSFRGPFVFDDVTAIVENPHIRRLWPIQEALAAPPETTVSGRPVVSLSLAIDYALGGLDVRIYHATNLAVHLLAALALMGIVRRTCGLPGLADRFGRQSWALAMIVAVLWVVHPIHTGAVTYLVQRAESIAGLLYLLTLYAFVRGASSPRAGWWYAAAVACCAAGMGAKEIVATAPLMVLLYDRTFLAGSYPAALRRRPGLYAGLAATWGILAALMLRNPRGASAGLGMVGIGPLDYAMTQCEVIVHYLRMAFWPRPMVLDYGWPVAHRFSDWATGGAILLALLAATVALMLRRPRQAFPWVWLFLILAPTSSFVPIADVAFDHRMYLPLAGLVVGVVMVAEIGRQALAGRQSGRPRLAAATTLATCLIAAAIAVTLGLATTGRNLEYRSRLALWDSNVRERPGNWRGYYGRAQAFFEDGDDESAIRDYDVAISLKPDLAELYVGRGVARARSGRTEEARADFTRAIDLDPSRAQAYYNRGLVELQLGRLDEALEDLTKAIGLAPSDPAARGARGAAYRRMGRLDEAIVEFSRAIDLDPGRAAAWYNRGLAHLQAGRLDRALEDIGKAIRIEPGNPSAYTSRAEVLRRLDRPREAAEDDARAARVRAGAGANPSR